MTQEDKARRYDEALESARNLYKDAIDMGDRLRAKQCEIIFPELEIDDERIREALIRFHKSTISIDGIKGKDILAWLEKQGEQKPTWSEEDETSIAINNPEAYRIGFADGKAHAEEEMAIAWLEKQGQVKENQILQHEDTHEDISCKENDNSLTREPKFKVGDWITDGQLTCKVLSVTSKSYELHLYNDDYCHFETDIQSVDKQYHLWNIKDAKDGDVLYLQKDGKEHIIIYKGIIKERFRTIVSAYCAYNGIVDAFCFADVSRYIDIAYGGIMPATKEQIDILFTKIKEAGYIWDANKKELKKISQRMLSAEAKEAFYGEPTTWSEKDEQGYEDAVEKATSYIQQHWIWNTKMIEDFENYMKGE